MDYLPQLLENDCKILVYLMQISCKKVIKNELKTELFYAIFNIKFNIFNDIIKSFKQIIFRIYSHFNANNIITKGPDY